MISKNWRPWYAGHNINRLEEKSANKHATLTETGSGMTNNKTLALQFVLYLVTCFDTWASKLSHIGRRVCFLADKLWSNPATCEICTESMSPGITWPKHDADALLSGSAKVIHVCKLTLPYPHTSCLVQLLQGLWHFCFCPNYLYLCTLFPVCELWKVRI